MKNSGIETINSLPPFILDLCEQFRLMNECSYVGRTLEADRNILAPDGCDDYSVGTVSRIGISIPGRAEIVPNSTIHCEDYAHRSLFCFIPLNWLANCVM